MSGETLAAVLEREHREIDAGISEFRDARARGEIRVAPLQQALAALRRHIFLEEQYLFPPLLEAGLFAPIFVMLREHGEIWNAMDDIESRMGDAPRTERGDEADEIHQRLVALLDAHNLKEEAIIYPQADSVLNTTADADLRAFLADGTMPDGWTCERAGA